MLKVVYDNGDADGQAHGCHLVARVRTGDQFVNGYHADETRKTPANQEAIIKPQQYAIHRICRYFLMFYSCTVARSWRGRLWRSGQDAWGRRSSPDRSAFCCERTSGAGKPLVSAVGQPVLVTRRSPGISAGDAQNDSSTAYSLWVSPSSC